MLHESRGPYESSGIEISPIRQVPESLDVEQVRRKKERAIKKMIEKIGRANFREKRNKSPSIPNSCTLLPFSVAPRTIETASFVLRTAGTLFVLVRGCQVPHTLHPRRTLDLHYPLTGHLLHSRICSTSLLDIAYKGPLLLLLYRISITTFYHNSLP